MPASHKLSPSLQYSAQGQSSKCRVLIAMQAWIRCLQWSLSQVIGGAGPLQAHARTLLYLSFVILPRVSQISSVPSAWHGFALFHFKDKAVSMLEALVVGSAAFVTALSNVTHEIIYKQLSCRSLQNSGQIVAKVELSFEGCYATDMKSPRFGEIIDSLSHSDWGSD